MQFGRAREAGTKRERISSRATSQASTALLRPQQQHRHADLMLHAIGGSPQEQISEKSMSVGAHSDQVASLLLHPFHDLAAGIAKAKFEASRNVGILKLRLNFLQIRGIFGNFRADGVAAVGTRSPTISNMQKYDTALRKLRQFLHMFDDRPITRCAIERHKNRFVHRPPPELAADNDVPRGSKRLRQSPQIERSNQ